MLNAGMVNLFLGLIWLVLGGAILGYEFATGEEIVRLRWFGLSPAWLMIVLAAYNFVRFYFNLRAARLRAAREQELFRRRPRTRRESDEPPNPELDFTSEPTTPLPPAPPPPAN